MIKRFSNLLPRMFMAMLVLWTAGALNAVAADQPAAKPKDDVVKVVYHADFADPRRFSAMLTNIHNMVSTYQAELVDYDVRIVFVSWGIRFVTQDKLAGTPFAEDDALKQRRADLLARLATLRDTQGVKLEVCGITREQIGLDEKKLIPGVTLVRSGVVRLVELQHQGFAYLKVE
ncbi:MAG: DsrE family protein [Gammaproteobacteria bacterium]|nr:DsrE family protein [Gammaproteobacteria bacterium]